MRTESRKARRPAPTPDLSESKRVPAAGPKPDAPSSESGNQASRQPDAPAAPDSISSRLPPIALTENGKIDVAKLRSGTKEKLKIAISDPELASALGISAPAVADSDETKMFATYVAPAIFGALNSVLVSVPRRYGFTAEASQVMAFNEAEVAQMAPLAGRVLQKHMGGKSKYQEELMLATMMLSGIMGKITLLEKQATVLRLQRQQPAPAATTPTTEAQVEPQQP